MSLTSFKFLITCASTHLREMNQTHQRPIIATLTRKCPTHSQEVDLGSAMWRTAQAGLRRQNLAFRSRTRSLPSRPSSHKPSALANLTKPPFASFVACLPGIEPILSSEIKSILSGWGGSRSSEHPKRVRPVRGGCHVRIASIEELYRLHLHVGTASHIYLRYI